MSYLRAAEDWRDDDWELKFMTASFWISINSSMMVFQIG